MGKDISATLHSFIVMLFCGMFITNTFLTKKKAASFNLDIALGHIAISIILRLIA